jgi:hypothetical protein
MDAGVDEHGRIESDVGGDEWATLNGFLDHQRATFAWKAAGLDATQLARPLTPSTMTLAGLMKHLASVEHGWFDGCLLGQPPPSRDRAMDRADPSPEASTARSREVDAHEHEAIINPTVALAASTNESTEPAAVPIVYRATLDGAEADPRSASHVHYKADQVADRDVRELGIEAAMRVPHLSLGQAARFAK